MGRNKTQDTSVAIQKSTTAESGHLVTRKPVILKFILGLESFLFPELKGNSALNFDAEEVLQDAKVQKEKEKIEKEEKIEREKKLEEADFDLQKLGITASTVSWFKILKANKTPLWIGISFKEIYFVDEEKLHVLSKESRTDIKVISHSPFGMRLQVRDEEIPFTTLEGRKIEHELELLAA